MYHYFVHVEDQVYLVRNVTNDEQARLKVQDFTGISIQKMTVISAAFPTGRDVMLVVKR